MTSLNSSYPKVSIIIPVYKITPYLYEAIDKCLNLDYPNFEILVGIDSNTKLAIKHSKIKILHTNHQNTGPAEKRDIGIRFSKADYIAFLDDDSYPQTDWLSVSMQLFKDIPDIAGIGGPGLTPPSDNIAQKITGAILSTFWGTGPYYYRFVKGNSRLVDDYPAYNLIVSRQILLKVGGFANKFYGGEDTALCIKLINAGHKILYHPDVVVFHHRRAFPLGYFKQIGNVGMHRGYFVKTYPQTSLRPSYFMPLIGVFTVVVSMGGLLQLPDLRPTLVLIWVAIYITVILDGLRSNKLLVSTFLPLCIFFSHVVYAFYFAKGLMSSSLKR